MEIGLASAICLNRRYLFFRYICEKSVFLALLITSLIALAVLMIVSFYVLAGSPYSSNWVSDMWGHMGGMMGGTEVPVQNHALPYFNVVFVVLVGVAIVSVGGLVYFFVFPEIKTTRKAASGKQVSAENGTTAYEAIVKTMTEEARKVIQVLTAHHGKYLQKYIRKEAGLSRLKTHRILARLADRGVVTLKKSGNTNEVLLSEWLRS
jgi:hypothetical protein